MLDLVKVTFDKWCVEYEVVIVGAGPAGIGCGLALRRAGAERVLVLEANRVGASFRCWPEQMRLITPSFHANPFFSNRPKRSDSGHESRRFLSEGTSEWQ